ncbi:hypothetical protein D3C80_1768080 [compost metagenome]
MRAVLEAGDQAVDREVVSPGRNHSFKRRRLLEALAARQAGSGQGQGAGLAVIAEPGQLGFAGHANGRGAIGRFITQQTVLFVF